MASVTLAGAADPVAVLTELRPANGRVEILATGTGRWTPAQPLAAFRPGDRLRVTGDGRAVIVFTGARGAQIVTAANSPLTVVEPKTGSLAARAQAVVADAVRSLTGARGRQLQVLGTRATGDLVLLAPRQGLVFADRVTFEWRGPADARFTVRVLGPGGLVWEQADVERRALPYPGSAPHLQPSTRYEWEVRTPGRVPQFVEFEVIGAAEGARVREALASLDARAFPPATLALLRAGVLFDAHLFAEARAELLAGLAASPNEPSLHFLLAHVYHATGLAAQAAAELAEAQSRARP